MIPAWCGVHGCVAKEKFDAPDVTTFGVDVRVAAVPAVETVDCSIPESVVLFPASSN
jgi:hypothetical protein